MRGVIVEQAGAPWKVVDDLEKPRPGPGQVLVKSIASAINPV
jgi:NADPH:quinone reductase-like Zn-dependent oxidoreductase